jgi:hypothetical protein
MTIITTKQQIEKAFAEWKRQAEETPEEFYAKDFTDTYAQDCTELFVKLLHEVN